MASLSDIPQATLIHKEDPYAAVLVKSLLTAKLLDNIIIWIHFYP